MRKGICGKENGDGRKEIVPVGAVRVGDVGGRGGVGDWEGAPAGEEAKKEEGQDREEPVFLDGFEYEVKRDGTVKERPAFITGREVVGGEVAELGGEGRRVSLHGGPDSGVYGRVSGEGIQAGAGDRGVFGDVQDADGLLPAVWERAGPANQVPGDVWFQFWMYLNYYDDPQDKEDQLSGFTHGKFLYPSPDGSYPTHPLWLYLSATAAMCFWRATRGRIKLNAN